VQTRTPEELAALMTAGGSVARKQGYRGARLCNTARPRR
jgi:hypothetical protein